LRVLKFERLCTKKINQKKLFVNINLKFFLIGGEKRSPDCSRYASSITPSSGALNRRAPQRPGLAFFIVKMYIEKKEKVKMEILWKTH
jgi:hypothetical protein